MCSYLRLFLLFPFLWRELLDNVVRVFPGECYIFGVTASGKNLTLGIAEVDRSIG
jgi:hypothetical protein